MITAADLAESLGPGLLRVVVPGRGTEVHDIVLAEPDDSAGRPGELVLGTGLTGPEAAVGLLRRVAAAGAAGVVLRDPPAGDPRVVRTARDLDTALIELGRHASWTHLVWLLRGVVDRAPAPDTAVPEVRGTHHDLFALADTAAKIADAPVTIEDARSRVLAHSAHQDTADAARMSTIVGRRVPPHLLAHYRAAGVFRRLARSDDPVMAPAGPDGTLPRLVVPVRAGDEWLGSVWVVARRPVPADRVRELTGLASVLALQLLRLRAEADIARRLTAGALRTALRGGTPETGGPPGGVPALPAGPWRVVRLTDPGEAPDPRLRLEVWESVVRRFGWHQPLLTDLGGLLFAVVTDSPRGGPPGGEPGSLDWLRQLLARTRPPGSGPHAAAGGLAHSPAELPRSRAEAAELGRLLTAGRPARDRGDHEDRETPADALVTLEDAWDAVVLERARAAVAAGPGLPGNPLTALRDHDREHGTSHLPTLAAWLDHYGDPRQAARVLRIHPNTLRYRLRGIGEVMPVDLSSPRLRLALRLQLAAWD
ncbi:helix-turn-helix domain-containing protein [Streptomyces sp. TRM 70361]|uniref:PucR family transcriptional regulator n=1 Tax=Streptomyces sp. TRM 70361 TaxID=3116553 RepID=UPI002E7BFE79|nr:helix-turn-helix domain-containing protein [Streptomyces sp. TRM 70361]MEE1937908.1 helix-turn-helix domain-containing protein [Streptomyces sp. TRM 70361]